MAEPVERAVPWPGQRRDVSYVRAPIEHVFEGAVVLDRDGIVRKVIAPGDELFGYDLSDAVGYDLFALIDSDDADELRAAIHDIAERRKLTVALELSVLRPDGGYFDIEAVGAHYDDGELSGVLVNTRDITERKALERSIRDAEQTYSAIIDSLVDGLIFFDPEGRVLRANRAVGSIFSVPIEPLVGLHVDDLIAPGGYYPEYGVIDPGGAFIRMEDHPIKRTLVDHLPVTGAIHGVLRPDGQRTWLRINASCIFAADGGMLGAVASFADVTEAYESSARLAEEQEFLNILLGNLAEGIVACDTEGRITMFNEAARRLHGLGPHSRPVGKIPSAAGLRHLNQTVMRPEENPLRRALAGEGLQDVEIFLDGRDGVQRRVNVNGQALRSAGGEIVGAVVAIRDITEQKRYEERLADMAMHDSLTGLANRTLLNERLREAVATLPRGGIPGGVDGAGLALFLLDLDDFKLINDTYGHDVGDDVLVAVAKRLMSAVRPSDTVARLGGDEFVVLCHVKAGLQEMERIAERIDTALADAYRINGRTMAVKASVGGLLVEDSSADPSKLLSRADDAMYAVKREHRAGRSGAP